MEDREIVALILRRDERGLEEASARYGGVCLALAFNVLRDEGDASECFNDALLRLWDAPPDDPGSLRAYLLTIVRNLAFDRLKLSSGLKRGAGEAISELSDMVSGGESVEEAIDRAELRRLINEFLRSLPARERVAFVRRYYYSESTEELSRRLSVRPGALLTMLSRTRAKLKIYLEKEGYPL